MKRWTSILVVLTSLFIGGCGGDSSDGSYWEELLGINVSDRVVPEDVSYITLGGAGPIYSTWGNCDGYTLPIVTWSNELTGHSGEALVTTWHTTYYDPFLGPRDRCGSSFSVPIYLDFGENVITFNGKMPNGYDQDVINVRRLGRSPTVEEYIPLDGSVTISWSPAVGAISYNLYLANTPYASKNNYSTIFTNVQSPFTASGLGNGHRYYFVMSALYGNGDDYYSDNYSFTPNSAPTNVYASAGDSLVALVWDDYPNAEKFFIYMASESGVTKDNWEFLTDGTKRQFSKTSVSDIFTVGGLENDKTYYFVVTTAANGDESLDSPEVAATPTQGSTAAVTTGVTVISGSRRLRGIIQNPVGYNTEVWFEYGTDTNYGTVTSSFVVSTYWPGEYHFNREVSSLIENTTYHYRLVSNNSIGTYVGEDRTFRTYTTPQLVIGDLTYPNGLKFDGEYLYWRDYHNGLMKLQVSTNQSSVLATGSTGGAGHVSITMNSNHLYWADNRTIFADSENNIWRVRLDAL